MNKMTLPALTLGLLFSAWLKANPLLDEEFIKTASVAAIEGAIKSGAEINARDENGSTALMVAAGNSDNPAVITTLITHGAEVNARGKDGGTALMWAAWYSDNPEVITALITHGAEVNARDKDGGTALMQAAEHNKNSEVITRLLAAGADPQLEDADGKTTLDYIQKNTALKGSEAYLQLVERLKP